MEELTYLKELVKKYDAHYFKGYFGFTLRDFTNRLGITPSLFSQILQGKRSLTEKRQAEFLQAFKDLQVKEKTQDFKESQWQIGQKELYRQLRKSLTTIFICANIFAMNVNFLQYLVTRRTNSPLTSLSLTTIPAIKCLKHFVVGIFLFFSTSILMTTFTNFLSFNLHYGI